MRTCEDCFAIFHEYKKTNLVVYKKQAVACFFRYSIVE